MKPLVRHCVCNKKHFHHRKHMEIKKILSLFRIEDLMYEINLQFRRKFAQLR